MRTAPWWRRAGWWLPVCLLACREPAPGFDRPFAVIHDPAQDVYLVVDHGPPGGGGARVVVVRPDGVVAKPRWLTADRQGVELSAPTGIAVQSGVVWLADGAVLRRFRCPGGEPLPIVAIPGAAVVHDVAAANDGALWVCGTRAGAAGLAAGAVWRVPASGEPEPFAAGTELGSPQALCATPGGLYLACADGGFRLLDGKGHATLLARADAGLGALRGLARLPGRDGGPPQWFASCEGGHRLVQFGLQGQAEPLPREFAAPGRCAADVRRGRLLVPVAGAGRLEVLQR